jgi:hypothetical protein
MKTLRPEQGIFGVMLLLTVGLTTWFGVRLVRTHSDVARSSVMGNTKAYVPPDAPEVMSNGDTKWPKPAAQKRGKAWVYGIFTPPEINYDPATQQFRTTAEEAAVSETVADKTEFGLTLVSVEPDEFPLQLVGYVGEPGHFLGTFENRANYETLLLKAGDQVPSLGLTVVDFRVERSAIEIPESMTVNEYRATATVRTNAGGDLITLAQGEVRLGGGWRVRVMLPGDEPTGRVMREGETVEVGNTRYTIDKIRLAPPSVDVTKKLIESNASEQQTLTLPAAASPTTP